MRSFRFSLQRVLTVRELETLQAQQALAGAQAAAKEAAAALAEIRAARQEFVVKLEERRARGMVAWEWTATSRHHEALSRQEGLAANALHAALERVATRQVELERALQREQVLEQLRDQQQAAYQYAEQLAEQAAIDEMAQRTRLVHKGVG